MSNVHTIVINDLSASTQNQNWQFYNLPDPIIITIPTQEIDFDYCNNVTEKTNNTCKGMLCGVG